MELKKKIIPLQFYSSQLEFLVNMKAKTGNSYSAIIRDLIQKEIERQQQTDKKEAA